MLLGSRGADLWLALAGCGACTPPRRNAALEGGASTPGRRRRCRFAEIDHPLPAQHISRLYTRREAMTLPAAAVHGGGARVDPRPAA